MPTSEQIRSTVDAYIDAYAINDTPAFLAARAVVGALKINPYSASATPLTN